MLNVFGRGLLVDRLAQQVEHTAQASVTYRHVDRTAGIDGVGTADQAVRGGHGDAAGYVITDMLRHFDDQLFPVIVKLHRVQQGG